MNSHTGAAEVVAVAVVETTEASVLVETNSVVVASRVAVSVVEVNKVE